MILQTWIIKCLKMLKTSEKNENFMRRAMENWRVKLKFGSQTLAKARILKSIFQRNLISSLLFVMMPLNYISRKFTRSYECTKSQEKMNHCMYMSDINIFAKN